MHANNVFIVPGFLVFRLSLVVFVSIVIDFSFHLSSVHAHMSLRYPQLQLSRQTLLRHVRHYKKLTCSSYCRKICFKRMLFVEALCLLINCKFIS